MRKSSLLSMILATVAVAFSLCGPAQAQWRAVSTCPSPAPGGSAIYPAGGTGLTGLIDINGVLCTNAAASGSTQQVTAVPSAAATAGVAPTATGTAASSLLLKSGAGNLYGLEVTAAASAGYVMVFDATVAPADGTVTPKYCKAVAANSSVELSWTGGPPAAFATGVVVVFSTTGCFTKTASATAYISGMVK